MILAAVLAAQVRTYHPVALRDLARGKVRQTHIEVCGFPTYLAEEKDGDLHIRICDSADTEDMDREHCIVAECIPKMPCERPRLGLPIIIRGISRFDNENGHKWYEIHPVEGVFRVERCPMLQNRSRRGNP